MKKKERKTKQDEKERKKKGVGHRSIVDWYLCRNRYKIENVMKSTTKKNFKWNRKKDRNSKRKKNRMKI